MSAISSVKICNMALTYLGADRITDLSDESEEARACNAIYDETLDDVLTDHPWSFAQKRAALAQLDETPVFTDDNVSIVYQKPTDCLKLNFVNIASAIVKIEGDKILSDTSGLSAKYTFRATDPQKYFPKFILAFATRLAADLAFILTASRTKGFDLITLYHDKRLPEAISVDSQQGTPLSVIQNEWTLSRVLGGSGQIAGRTGQEVWFPIGCCC